MYYIIGQSNFTKTYEHPVSYITVNIFSIDSPRPKQSRYGRRIPNNSDRKVDPDLTYQNPTTIAYDDFSLPIYTKYNARSANTKRFLR